MRASHISRARAHAMQHDLRQHRMCTRLLPGSPPQCRVRASSAITQLRSFTLRAASEDGGGAAAEEAVRPLTGLGSDDDVQCLTTGTEVVCVVDEEGRPGGAGLQVPLQAEEPTESLALLVLPFFLWGSSMAGMKYVLDDVSPLLVAAARLLPSGALLVAYAAYKGRPLPQTGLAWAAVSFFALVDATLFQGALAEGLTRTSAGLGSVIIDSQPLTVAILAAAFFGESIPPLGALGLVLGLAGLVLMELPPLQDGGIAASVASATAALSGDGLLSFGETWMFIAAQAMAIGTVWVRVIVKQGTDPVMATGLHMLLGGVPLLALSAVREPAALPRLLDNGLTLENAALLSYISLLGGAVAYGLFFRAASRGSLLKLSSLTFLTPVFAVLCGYATLGETLTPQQLAGAGIVLAGVTLVNTKRAGAT